MYTLIYIYIYVYRERERERERYIALSLSLFKYICVYIYIYIYTHTYIYIYIYIYIYYVWQANEGPTRHNFSLVQMHASVCTANLRTKIMDSGGSDSSTISILRGGTPRPTRNFLESSSQAILVGIMLVGRLGVYACVCMYTCPEPGETHPNLSG